MNNHPFYNQAVKLLAQLKSTTPAILTVVMADDDTHEGLESRWQVKLLAEALQDAATNGTSGGTGAGHADTESKPTHTIGSHWPSAANLTVLTGSDHGAKRGIQPPSLDIKPK